MVSRHLALGCVFAAVSLPAAAADATDRAVIEALITKHAKANDVPVSLVHRVVRRESNYNPRATPVEVEPHRRGRLFALSRASTGFSADRRRMGKRRAKRRRPRCKLSVW